MSIQEDRTKLFELIKAQGFIREKIVLSSGKESDYYFDLRRVTLTSAGAALSARLILEAVSDQPYDAVGGPTLGADPMVGAVGVVAHESGKPISTFIIRSQPKAHGRRQMIEGPDLPKGAKVILIDDVATSGGSFIRSIDVLKENGAEVLKAVCLLDREEGAAEALSQKGCDLISIFTSKEFLSDQ